MPVKVPFLDLSAQYQAHRVPLDTAISRVIDSASFILGPEGECCGSLGDAAAFSFYPGKNLGAYGDGGAIATQNDDLAARLRLRRNYGQTIKYQHIVVGENCRLDGLQAAILAAKLPFLDGW